MTDNITYASRRDRRRAKQGGFAANAGTAGRASAAVLAASGLVITTGVAAQAAEVPQEGRAASTVQLNTAELDVERASNTTDVAVQASAEVENEVYFASRAAVSSQAAAEPVVEEAPAEPVSATPASHTTSGQAATEQPSAQTSAPAQQETQQQSTQQQSQPAEQTQQSSSSSAEAASSESSASAPSAPSGGGSIISAAYSTIGTPHVMGGTTPGSGIDCSGMIQYAYAQAGISVPRTTYGMMGLPSVSSPQPGDIVIANGGGHGGIYVGNGQVISTTASGGVRVHGLHESWHNVVSYHRPG